MSLRVNIHFKRKPDRSHLATVVMVAGKMVRYRRYILEAGVEPYSVYGDIAAKALNSLAMVGKTVDEVETETMKKPAGRLVYLRGPLPLE